MFVAGPDFDELYIHQPPKTATNATTPMISIGVLLFGAVPFTSFLLLISLFYGLDPCFVYVFFVENIETLDHSCCDAFGVEAVVG